MYTLQITFKSIKKLDNIKQNLIKLKKTKINGFFFVKQKNKIFTVLKSPHVNKKSREHFIYKKYHKKININFLNFFQLINFLLIIKKVLVENFIIQTKIIKN